MTSLEFGAHPPRLSDADREHALDVLRESAVQGRVSQNTFMRRMELILQARQPDELYAVLHDLRSREKSPGIVLRAVSRASSFPQRLRRAWRSERLPQLMLPGPGPYPLSIGRAPGSMLRLTDYTVSRAHAQLRHTSHGWSLRDLGSSNEIGRAHV